MLKLVYFTIAVVLFANHAFAQDSASDASDGDSGTQEDPKVALLKSEVMLHRYALQGPLDETRIKAFLTEYYASQTKVTLPEDILASMPADANDQTRVQAFLEKIRKLKQSRDETVAADVQSSYAQLVGPIKPTAKYFQEHGTFQEAGIAEGFFSDFDYDAKAVAAAATNSSAPPSPGTTNSPQNVFWSLRKTPGLLDSNFNVQPDASGKPMLDNGAQDTGALLSYNRNFATEKNTWTAQGSVGMPYRFYQGPSQIGLVNAWLVPVIDFNHLGGSAVLTKNRLDSLDFTLGTVMHFGLPSKDELGRELTFRLAQVDETDFNFTSLIAGGEAEFEYKDTGLGLGEPSPLIKNGEGFALVEFFPRIFLKADGGEVLDSGEKLTITDGQEYARIGPTISLNIYAGEAVSKGISPFLPKIQFNYGHLMGITGHAYNDYNAIAKWSLDEKGIVSATISYENGGLNANGDKANQITFGLTLKN